MLNEVTEITAKDGKKFDQDKLDWTLLPWQSINEVVKVLAFGAKKYAPNAWMNVPDAKRRYLAAAYRHLYAVSTGETRDEESGCLHLAHCVCCLLFLMFFEEK